MRKLIHYTLVLSLSLALCKVAVAQPLIRCQEKVDKEGSVIRTCVIDDLVCVTELTESERGQTLKDVRWYQSIGKIKKQLTQNDVVLKVLNNRRDDLLAVHQDSIDQQYNFIINDPEWKDCFREDSRPHTRISFDDVQIELTQGGLVLTSSLGLIASCSGYDEVVSTFNWSAISQYLNIGSDTTGRSLNVKSIAETGKVNNAVKSNRLQLGNLTTGADTVLGLYEVLSIGHNNDKKHYDSVCQIVGDHREVPQDYLFGQSYDGIVDVQPPTYRFLFSKAQDGRTSYHDRRGIKYLSNTSRVVAGRSLPCIAVKTDRGSVVFRYVADIDSIRGAAPGETSEAVINTMILNPIKARGTTHHVNEIPTRPYVTSHWHDCEHPLAEDGKVLVKSAKCQLPEPYDKFQILCPIYYAWSIRDYSNGSRVLSDTSSVPLLCTYSGKWYGELCGQNGPPSKSANSFDTYQANPNIKGDFTTMHRIVCGPQLTEFLERVRKQFCSLSSSMDSLSHLFVKIGYDMKDMSGKNLYVPFRTSCDTTPLYATSQSGYTCQWRDAEYNRIRKGRRDILDTLWGLPSLVYEYLNANRTIQLLTYHHQLYGPNVLDSLSNVLELPNKSSLQFENVMERVLNRLNGQDDYVFVDTTVSSQADTAHKIHYLVVNVVDSSCQIAKCARWYNMKVSSVAPIVGITGKVSQLPVLENGLSEDSFGYSSVSQAGASWDVSNELDELSAIARDAGDSAIRNLVFSMERSLRAKSVRVLSSLKSPVYRIKISTVNLTFPQDRFLCLWLHDFVHVRGPQIGQTDEDDIVESWVSGMPPYFKLGEVPTLSDKYRRFLDSQTSPEYHRLGLQHDVSENDADDSVEAYNEMYRDQTLTNRLQPLQSRTFGLYQRESSKYFYEIRAEYEDIRKRISARLASLKSVEHEARFFRSIISSNSVKSAVQLSNDIEVVRDRSVTKKVDRFTVPLRLFFLGSWYLQFKSHTDGRRSINLVSEVSMDADHFSNRSQYCGAGLIQDLINSAFYKGPGDRRIVSHGGSTILTSPCAQLVSKAKLEFPGEDKLVPKSSVFRMNGELSDDTDWIFKSVAIDLD